jgi:hypothetical protein
LYPIRRRHSQQQRLQVRPPATGTAAPADTTPDTPTAPLPSPTNDKTSALGRALAACNQDTEKEAFTLPGLKDEVTLDRCYKGRAHLICVFTALSTEAKSLTGTYTKIVDAKYPDLNTVDGVCQINAQTLAADIAGSEDFAKRFKELKSQYEAATKCAGNVEQGFKDASLAGPNKTDGSRSVYDGLDRRRHGEDIESIRTAFRFIHENGTSEQGNEDGHKTPSCHVHERKSFRASGRDHR